jgi:hypothetical protein
MFLSACLKIPEGGCVVLDQPQQSPIFKRSRPCFTRCGWSATQPRSFFRQALTGALLASVSALTAQSTSAHWQFAPTPPLGWNSWDCFGTTITDGAGAGRRDGPGTTAAAAPRLVAVRVNKRF